MAGETMKAFQENAFQNVGFQIRNLAIMAITLDDVIFDATSQVYKNTIAITLDGIGFRTTTWYTPAQSVDSWTVQPNN